MINLHNPRTAQYQRFNNWDEVAAAVDDGAMLMMDGVVVTADFCVKMQAAEAQAKAKATGELYANSGVIVPFKNEDALALLQVKAAFEMGVPATVIEFSNGSKLPMTAPEFQAFALWFVAKRNAFFI